MPASSTKSGVPLDIHLTAVPALVIFQMMVLVCAEITVWLCLPQWPLLYRLPLAVLMPLPVLHGIRKYALLAAADSVHRVTWQPQHGWQVYTRRGDAVPVSLSQRSRVFRWILFLCFTANATMSGRRRSYSVVLLPGTIDSTCLRQLRVHLNMRDCLDCR